MLQWGVLVPRKHMPGCTMAVVVRDPTSCLPACLSACRWAGPGRHSAKAEPLGPEAAHLASFGAQAALVADWPLKLLIGRVLGYQEDNIRHHIQVAQALREFVGGWCQLAPLL